MNSYFGGLAEMLLGQNLDALQGNPTATVVFATGCAIIGLIAVLLDMAFYTIRGQSLLKLRYGDRKRTSIFLVAWTFGAFSMGYIGQYANVFQVNMLASVSVGFAWPMLFTGLLKKLNDIDVQSEPEQAPVLEE